MSAKPSSSSTSVGFLVMLFWKLLGCISSLLRRGAVLGVLSEGEDRSARPSVLLAEGDATGEVRNVLRFDRVPVSGVSSRSMREDSLLVDSGV